MNCELLIVAVCVWGVCQATLLPLLLNSPPSCFEKPGCPVSRHGCPVDEFFKQVAACDNSDKDSRTISVGDLIKNVWVYDEKGIEKDCKGRFYLCITTLTQSKILTQKPSVSLIQQNFGLAQPIDL